MGFKYILRNFTSLLFSLDAEDIIFPADASVTCLAGSIFTQVYYKLFLIQVKSKMIHSRL